MTDSPHAQIDWDANDQPHSRLFDDVYFADAMGLEESRYVFLEQNDLARRFAELPEGGRLVIGETGFGTGLNFFSAWQLFDLQAPKSARLHFVSVEKYPLSLADLKRALASFPSLQRYTAEFLQHYVAVHAGFQRFTLAAGRVCVTLLIGDAHEQFSQLDAQIDAWFLDGFAPAKNPQMWTAELFAELARLSAPGATISTFTSTGYARRALNAAGLQMRRIPGMGKKWEILRGQFLGLPENLQKPRYKPWFERPAPLTGERHALVIGAGLAGCATADSLAARGWRVSLLDRHADVAGEASGNPQGVLYLKLSAHGTVLSQLIVGGFGYTRRLLEHLQRGTDWDACGVIQLTFNAKEAERHAQLSEAFETELLAPITAEAASQRAGVPLPSGGLWYPEGGWVHPPALCRWQAGRPGIQRLLHREVVELRRVGELWQAWSGDQYLASAPLVVLAGAAEVKTFAAHLPLKRIRGQISYFTAPADAQPLRSVVCAAGYVAPARQGEYTVGASFDFHNVDPTPNAKDHAANVALLESISPAWCESLGSLDPEHLQGRVAFRCTSPDYLPIIGPLADRPEFERVYAQLGKNAQRTPDFPCPWLPGLYVNSGHGSRGLITAPLCAELLAAWVENEPLPVSRAVAQACHPNRFAVRDLMQNKTPAVLEK